MEPDSDTAKVDVEPIERILAPFQRFLHAQATSGIVLMAATVVALAWANSPWSESYAKLWHIELSIGFHSYSISKDLHWWINDAFMAAFFFVVGLEIKRELMVGELSSPRKAALPIAAALGGMIVPAILYAACNLGGEGLRGWGIPMATDIAFALGVLALLGKSVPLSAKVFLTALAIVDDIGASMVIAVFYTDEISWPSLLVAGAFFLVMLGMNRLGVRSALAFFLVGLGLWFAFLQSGIHPTLSGVLGALAIPSRVRINATEFLRKSRFLVDRFEEAGATGSNVLTNPQQRGALDALETVVHQAETPLQQLEHYMHPWVSFVIMPVFALANAGVRLNIDIAASMTHPVTLGIMLGLVAGKQLGIFFFALLATKLGLARRPDDLSWRYIYGLAWLGGIGFTMSLFIGALAFGDSPLLETAKLAILIASVVCGVGGWIFLSKTNPGQKTSAATPEGSGTASTA